MALGVPQRHTVDPARASITFVEFVDSVLDQIPGLRTWALSLPTGSDGCYKSERGAEQVADNGTSITTSKQGTSDKVQDDADGPQSGYSSPSPCS